MSVISDPPALWRLCDFYQKTIKTCRSFPARHITQKPRRIPAGGWLFLPKRARLFWAKGLQSAARIICSLKANKFHTCRLRRIFCQVHAPAKNGLHFICRLRAANSARLFDRLARCRGLALQFVPITRSSQDRTSGPR